MRHRMYCQLTRYYAGESSAVNTKLISSIVLSYLVAMIYPEGQGWVYRRDSIVFLDHSHIAILYK